VTAKLSVLVSRVRVCYTDSRTLSNSSALKRWSLTHCIASVSFTGGTSAGLNRHPCCSSVVVSAGMGSGLQASQASQRATAATLLGHPVTYTTRYTIRFIAVQADVCHSLADWRLRITSLVQTQRSVPPILAQWTYVAWTRRRGKSHGLHTVWPLWADVAAIRIIKPVFMTRRTSTLAVLWTVMHHS